MIIEVENAPEVFLDLRQSTLSNELDIVWRALWSAANAFESKQLFTLTFRWTRVKNGSAHSYFTWFSVDFCRPGFC